MITSFAISIKFDTPFINGQRSNLDAVLANIIYNQNRLAGMDELMAIEHAHSHVPLVSHGKVYAGSSAMVPYSKTHAVVMISSMMSHLQADVKPEDALRPKKVVRSTSTLFEGIPGNLMNIYQASEVPDNVPICYLGRGDMTKVDELLDVVRSDGLGKKRSIGYGKVRSLAVEAIEDYEFCGMVSSDGTVLRPIPKDVLDNLPVKPEHFALAFETFQPPYWKGERTICYVPPQRKWKKDDIDLIVGFPT